MAYTVNSIIYNTPCEEGLMGHVFLSNGYGAVVIEIAAGGSYEIAFLKQQDSNTWAAVIDEKLATISQVNDLRTLTADEVNNYLAQLELL